MLNLKKLSISYPFPVLSGYCPPRLPTPSPPPPQHTHSSWALVIGQPSFGVALFSFFTVSAVTRQPVLPVSRDHTLFCLEEESALIQIEDLFNPENL